MELGAGLVGEGAGDGAVCRAAGCAASLGAVSSTGAGTIVGEGCGAGVRVSCGAGDGVGVAIGRGAIATPSLTSTGPCGAGVGEGVGSGKEKLPGELCADNADTGAVSAIALAQIIAMRRLPARDTIAGA
ncbi:hypothetical protein [Erythrobacter sp. MTPC3]|uniref:hypothetical protein n=1 Tax=Erythrobacter sp. MTPC3 TaxID=3056564 RepID=UPI0036F298F1